MQSQTIRQIIAAAWANPTGKACYYSGMFPTASPRLNELGQWDWTPARTRGIASPGTILFPLALGCPPMHQTDFEWIEPILHGPEDVHRVVPPSVHAGRTGEVLANLRSALAQSPEDPVRLVDIQSPLQVAEMMWDESFYCALADAPEAVHALLERITAFIIDFILEFKRIAGRRLNAASWPGIWSDDTGVMVADDTMTLISPAMHLEFSVPYLNQIARACGPLIYHSCSWRKAYFQNITAIGPVKSYNWNPGNSDDPAELIAAFSGQALMAPHLCLNMHRDPDALRWPLRFADEAELLEYHLDNMRANTCMYWFFSDVVTDRVLIEKIYDLLHRRGLTPQAQGLA